MLPRNRRIGRNLYPQGRPLHYERGVFSSLSIYKGEGKTRFSFSISKKVASLAVERNRIRGWGYLAIENILEQVKEGFLLRFSVNLKPSSARDFAGEVENLLKKGNITK